ncbi:hypothetical protein PR202_gb29213 [Eleusine coracana subsp. coracana]|uniref:Uncharacterized protein n=1 Tax=Eleusine coracana subsp. coracana TaxID=191504 RepID=A0AAV5FWI5_ELECO|nr:hypothetical protein PR202_gb29213 [Eleusine coracana subsp. coracana]
MAGMSSTAGDLLYRPSIALVVIVVVAIGRCRRAEVEVMWELEEGVDRRALLEVADRRAPVEVVAMAQVVVSLAGEVTTEAGAVAPVAGVMLVSIVKKTFQSMNQGRRERPSRRLKPILRRGRSRGKTFVVRDLGFFQIPMDGPAGKVPKKENATAHIIVKQGNITTEDIFFKVDKICKDGIYVDHKKGEDNMEDDDLLDDLSPEQDTTKKPATEGTEMLEDAGNNLEMAPDPKDNEHRQVAIEVKLRQMAEEIVDKAAFDIIDEVAAEVVAEDDTLFDGTLEDVSEEESPSSYAVEDIARPDATDVEDTAALPVLRAQPAGMTYALQADANSVGTPPPSANSPGGPHVALHYTAAAVPHTTATTDLVPNIEPEDQPVESPTTAKVEMVVSAQFQDAIVIVACTVVTSEPILPVEPEARTEVEGAECVHQEHDHMVSDTQAADLGGLLDDLLVKVAYRHASPPQVTVHQRVSSMPNMLLVFEDQEETNAKTQNCGEDANFDFHALPRKVLQVVCKKLEIRANTTNKEMAKALSKVGAYSHVIEALDKRDTMFTVLGLLASQSHNIRKIGDEEVMLKAQKLAAKCNMEEGR